MSDFDLGEFPIFKGVDEKYLDDIFSSSDICDYKQGEFVFHQNDIGDAMYIIVKGELQVILDPDKTSSEPIVIETLQCGALFGEMCVFGHQKRSASVRAQVDSIVLKIEGEDFRSRVYSKELDALLICYNIAKLLSDRLIATNLILSFYP